MKVIHFSAFMPHRCGLYHTAKDLVLAERGQGINAFMVDFDGKEHKGGYKDGTFELSSLKEADDADILIRHSAFPPGYKKKNCQRIMAIHGRPESSVILQKQDNIPVIAVFKQHLQEDPKMKFITFWQEYMPIWAAIIPDEKLFYVPATVDLDFFKPAGKSFDWDGKDGHPNILIMDMWREDVTPFGVVFAAAEFQEKYCSSAKIHIVGYPIKEYDTSASHFIAGLQKKGIVGHVAGQMQNIRKYYNSADIVISPHVIATRIIRESLACGVPLIGGEGNRFTNYQANPMDITGCAAEINRCWRDIQENGKDIRLRSRETAEREFSLTKAGKIAKSIFERILE